jgi:predicted acetylornithine/succinylornithine family transaminase
MSKIFNYGSTPLSTAEIIGLCDKYLLKNVNRIPIALVRGDGLRVWDADGKEYLDFIGGIATCAFGHAPKFMADILHSQALTLIHVSNLFYNEPMARLAKLLTESSGLNRVFFCNSGAEANECAFKMARKHAYDHFGESRYKIISANNSFHGRTMAAISMTGQPNMHIGFRPMVPGIVFVPYGDLAAMDEAMDESVAAVMLEPIQGEGGVLLPPPGYLKETASIAKSRNILLILDEVQTGLGRTGKDFAFRHFDVKPDILTLGKALGSGYPIAATLASEEAALSLCPGSHSTTVGGAPLAMQVALELSSRILDPEFLDKVASMGEYFRNKLLDVCQTFPSITDEVRGLGLILAIQLKTPSAPVSQRLMKKGFLVNATAGTVLRFVPPLTVSEGEIDLLISALKDSLSEEIESRQEDYLK